MNKYIVHFYNELRYKNWKTTSKVNEVTQNLVPFDQCFVLQWTQSNIDMVLYKLKGVLGQASKDGALAAFKAKDSKGSGSLSFEVFRESVSAQTGGMLTEAEIITLARWEKSSQV